MALIDLSSKKYNRDKVVVKCGDREFVATPDDATLEKIVKIGKKQMADGLKMNAKLNKIDFNDLKDDEIDTAVDDAVTTVAFAKGDYIKLADAIFGRGAGNAIYKYLGSSTLAMQDVMTDVINELYAQNDENKKAEKEKYTSETKEVD